MKYIVTLGIEEFEFEDGNTALAFAELVVKNFVPTEYCKKLTPCITVTEEGSEEEC